MTPIAYSLDKSLPVYCMDALPRFPPTGSSTGVGGTGEIQHLGHTNYRPMFCNMDM